jgi:hypothetical protein
MYAHWLHLWSTLGLNLGKLLSFGDQKVQLSMVELFARLIPIGTKSIIPSGGQPTLRIGTCVDPKLLELTLLFFIELGFLVAIACHLACPSPNVPLIAVVVVRFPFF